MLSKYYIFGKKTPTLENTAKQEIIKNNNF